MRHALDEAAQAASAGDVPVGAVVLGPDGALLAVYEPHRGSTAKPSARLSSAQQIAVRSARPISWALG